MGGDCLNYGCVPSKALLAAAKRAQHVRASEAFGIASSEPVIDFARVMAHVRGVIAAIEPNDSQERFEKLGVTVIRAQARFRDEPNRRGRRPGDHRPPVRHRHRLVAGDPADPWARGHALFHQ